MSVFGTRCDDGWVIHETIGFVVGRDGIVKVDRYTFDVVGCP